MNLISIGLLPSMFNLTCSYLILLYRSVLMMVQLRWGFECCVGACFDDSASLNRGMARMVCGL